MSFMVSPPIFLTSEVYSPLYRVGTRIFFCCSFFIDILATVGSPSAGSLGKECRGSPTGRADYGAYLLPSAQGCSTITMICTATARGVFPSLVAITFVASMST